MPVLAPAAVLSRDAAIEYVGSERLFRRLLDEHGDILTPFSRASNGRSTYLVKRIDAALDVAQAAGSFVEETTRPPRPPRRQ